ncbi:hypothetical protein B0H14DRAFT_2570082 [Mycena olivaceomarginata]|nr:hypothetical protein B0H14DRAFT_2570082 [Mycena olivaceomarginata]
MTWEDHPLARARHITFSLYASSSSCTTPPQSLPHLLCGSSPVLCKVGISAPRAGRRTPAGCLKRWLRGDRASSKGLSSNKMDSDNANVPTTHIHQLSRRTVLDHSTSSLSGKSRRSKRSRKETRLTEDQGKVLAVHLDKTKVNNRKDNTIEKNPTTRRSTGGSPLFSGVHRLSIPPPTILARTRLALARPACRPGRVYEVHPHA